MSLQFRDGVLGATELSERMGQAHRPTDQQIAVIQAPAAPALVIAGAGSGKTETMAARVVWLVANGFVRPGEVLGLTFTRKAAGELAQRVRERIAALGALGVAPAADDPFDVPTIATYNSFANALFRENALAIGREADGVLLGEAAAYRLARSIVESNDDARLMGSDRSLEVLTKGVLRIAHALSDNDVRDPGAVAAFGERFAAIAERPSGSRGITLQKALDAIEPVTMLPLLVELAGRYADEKRRRGLIEYSDQVAFAAEAVRRRPTIADGYRERYKVVLFDEYQDTSVLQTELLSGIFAQHPVMAVGDPNQSIYGFRGASADNLQIFGTAFAGGAVQTFSLMTSWRNPGAVLAAANRIARPLNAKAVVDVAPLERRPGAPDGAVEVRFAQTVLEEAEQVAAWFADAFVRAQDAGAPPPTAALLMRAWAPTEIFTRALRAAGVRYHVLGLGGLLEQPAVVDVVCALKVLVDPDAGSELLRLLAGARWRIGVRDLRALRNLASWLAKRDFRQQLLGDDVRELLSGSVADDEGASIVEALDFIGTARPGHGALADFSSDGLDRLRDAAAQFAELRGRLGMDLIDLVTLVVQTLDLDLEVWANESAAGGQAGLDAFIELAAGFLASDDAGGGVRVFLDWLYEAERMERFSPRSDKPEPGSVQVLTIHGSKGLEWQYVAVPRLVADELPDKYKDGNGWVRFGQLPFPFCGDRGALPELRWDEQVAPTQKQFMTNLDTFKEELGLRHQDEERRLAYVAVTRASERLLLSGSYWGGQAKPRRPSVYLDELIDAGIVDRTAIPELAAEANPIDGALFDPVMWPKNPLRGREAAVHAAADAVRHRIDLGPGDPARATGPWHDDVALLLAELGTRRHAGALERPPVRIPASRFKDFVSDPGATLRGLHRPMPERPYTATRIGTLFHSWVEQRSGVFGQAEVIDATGVELDDVEPDNEADAGRLAALKATFERSRWAGRKPAEVEVEIHAPLAGQVFVCKLDAVYALPGGRYEIVDWKTGKPPVDADDLERKQFQLALYRHAFATWKGIDPDEVDAVFYFVAEDRIIEPTRIYSSSELAELWFATFAESPSGSTGAKPGE